MAETRKTWLVEFPTYQYNEDVKAIAKDVLRHRVGLTYEAEAENVNVEQVIVDILGAVQVP